MYFSFKKKYEGALYIFLRTSYKLYRIVVYIFLYEICNIGNCATTKK